MKNICTLKNTTTTIWFLFSVDFISPLVKPPESLVQRCSGFSFEEFAHPGKVEVYKYSWNE